MAKKKKKILLPEFKGVSKENLDLLINIDLNRSFYEFKQERYDNNFDLTKQFNKERNNSRNFRIYGTIDSTIVNCDNLNIEVYKDSGYTDLHSIINTSKVSYDAPNVFGKTRGKYIAELNGYDSDAVYFIIRSDNFYYKDQTWEQRVVFYDADGNFAEYGSDTIDINFDEEIVTINNDFPFFFNKHWIRKNYSVIEEKPAKISFNVSTSTIREGEVANIKIFLDKPSPFGNETSTFLMSENSFNSDFHVGNSINHGGGPQFVFPVDDPPPLDPDDPLFEEEINLFDYNGKLLLFITHPPDKSNFIIQGANFYITSGDYAGTYTILHSNPITTPPYQNYYQIVLNTEFDPLFDNMAPLMYRSGSLPDISVALNGGPIEFPYPLGWNIDEQEKDFSVSANTDFEIEFKEVFYFEFEDHFRVEKGEIPTTEVIVEDNTERHLVALNLGSLYQNRHNFTGRTFYDVFTDEIVKGQTVQSPSILRNGHFYEGRNEEFYPVDDYVLTIANNGSKTVFPENPDFGITEETLFNEGEIREITVKTDYISTQKQKVKIKFAESFGDPNPDLKYYINGTRLWSANARSGYLGFKASIDGGADDIYENHRVKKPFTTTFNDNDLEVILEAKSTGQRLDVGIVGYTADTITTLTEFIPSDQIEKKLFLLANSNQNTTANYSIVFGNLGYRTTEIKAEFLPAVAPLTEYHLGSAYSNIFRPYYSDIGLCYHYSSSTQDDVVHGINAIINNQPSYMPIGNAYINGLLFLADSSFAGNRENLTSIGNEEETFVAEFLPFPIDLITCTYENVRSTPTNQMTELIIPFSSNFPDDNSEIRSFDFSFGDYVPPTKYIFGGNFQYFTLGRNNAQYWWNNNVRTSDENGNLLTPVPLGIRLDTGDGNDIAEGPVSGFTLNNNQESVWLVSKNAGVPFSIENIMNYPSLSGINIRIKHYIPNLLVGEYNSANNHMGGFNTELSLNEQVVIAELGSEALEKSLNIPSGEGDEKSVVADGGKKFKYKLSKM